MSDVAALLPPTVSTSRPIDEFMGAPVSYEIISERAMPDISAIMGTASLQAMVEL